MTVGAEPPDAFEQEIREAQRMTFLQSFRTFDSFTTLFVMVLLTLATYSFYDPGQTANLLITAILSLTLILAFRTSHAPRFWVRTVAAVSLIIIAGAILIVAIDPADLSQDFAVIWLILALPAPIVVLKRVLSHDVVTRETVVGALSVYLLVALVFTFAFESGQRIGGDPFFNQGIVGDSSDFVYFSLVTITTLGYGDLSPATEYGRFAATTEAVIGQIYLVTIVGFLVGAIGASRRMRKSQQAGASEASDAATEASDA